jgi:DNA-binding NtrC family response regulator
VIARDTVPAAVLLAGRSGVGTRLTATAIAQGINRLQPPSFVLVERDACTSRHQTLSYPTAPDMA